MGNAVIFNTWARAIGKRAWVGKPFPGDLGFYWATDDDSGQHGPYDSFDKAEEAARSALGLTHDE